MSEGRPAHDGGDATLRWLVVVSGIGMVVVDVVGMYVLLDGFGVPAVATVVGTAVTAAVVGGSFARVAGARLFESDRTRDPAAKSTVERVTEVVVSVTVLSGVTVFLGYGGGLALTLLAALGGPDPKSDDEPLRERLLAWAARNREFMRRDGEGELPMSP